VYIGVDLRDLVPVKNDYKEKSFSTDREKGGENKRVKVTRGSRNPKQGKRKHYIVHKLSRSN
jgi:hypothetical protein